MSMGYQKDWFDEKERKDKEDGDKKVRKHYNGFNFFVIVHIMKPTL